MTSRERMIKTLQFQNPDRTPRDLWALPGVTMAQKDSYEALLQRFPLDIGRPHFKPGQSRRASGTAYEVGRYVDEWGSVWHVAEYGVAGEVKEPILADGSGLKAFQAPWELIHERDLSPVQESCEKSDLFMMSDCCARPFERMQFLRGTENVFLDLAYGTSEFFQLLRKVHEFYLEDVAAWSNTAVDAVMTMDDWGAQGALLISPKQWREVFKPLYKDYCDIIHGAGKYAFFHSDGHIEAIYGDLIEVGMDAINSQLFCMDIEALGLRHKGKVTFWGEMDRQHLLPFGTPAEVREAVRRVRNALSTGTGGLIAQCEWGKNNPRENIEALYEEWMT